MSTPSRGPLLQLDECCEKPLEKKSVAFGADEPNSSEPAGLKEGVFRMPGGGWIDREEEGVYREGGGGWWVCILVLRGCFVLSVVIVKGGVRCTLVVC